MDYKYVYCAIIALGLVAAGSSLPVEAELVDDVPVHEVGQIHRYILDNSG